MKAFWFLLLAVLVASFTANGAEMSAFRAKILDIEGKGVAGAKLFVYDSPNVRRAADFISPVSGPAGEVSLPLPVGTYWIVARFKSDGKYGPLMPGDKHSGEPFPVEVGTESPAVTTFVVADIREIGQKKVSTAADAVRVRGRIVDGQGRPVANAYIYAHCTKEVRGFPDYLSTWSDDDGYCILYLPSTARLFLGATREFPPAEKLVATDEFVPGDGKIAVAIDVELKVQ